MQNLLWVFLGGGIGSISRYLLSRWMNQAFPEAWFPVGTFSANLLGCFLIGVILSALNRFGIQDLRWSLLLATGFCGGFTTFSSFAYENNLLWEEGKLFGLWMYIVLSVSLGFGASFLGICLLKSFR